jgi:BirA family biotin operon repressor/biotin-[acetyl-CoA-carboxylase] ligase
MLSRAQHSTGKRAQAPAKRGESSSSEFEIFAEKLENAQSQEPAQRKKNSSKTLRSLWKLIGMEHKAFNREEFLRLLKTKHVGRECVYLESTGSTMEDAGRIMSEGFVHGTIIVADEQKHGKGRGERVWESEAAANLTFTLLIRGTPEDISRIHLFTPTAVVRVLRNRRINAKSKWPNDVWVAGRKICGILPRSEILGRNFAFSIGIGLNVNQVFPDMETVDPAFPSRISMRNILGDVVSRESVLADLCFEFESLLELPFDALQQHYAANDLLLGHKIIVMPQNREGAQRQEATALRFNADASLVVSIDNEEKTLLNGEVTIRPTAIDDLRLLIE